MASAKEEPAFGSLVIGHMPSALVTAVWIEPTGTDIGLISSTIHVINEHAGHFGKDLPRRFFSNVGIKALEVYDLVFLPDQI